MNDASDPNADSTAATLAQQFGWLTNFCGLVELDDRSFVSVKGEDRQKFLHNFCTNEIKELAVSKVCEAFVLNEKGKLLGYVHVIADSEELLLTGHGQQSEILIQHLDKYIIREDVELSDRTDELRAIFVCGDQAAQCLAELFGELPELNESVNSQVESHQVKIVQTEIAGVGFLLICDASSVEELKSALLKHNIAQCSREALHFVRVQAKTPWFGIDADESNLPQELQRDEIAISFEKGCYLGQETVTRIDARGRVNQLLVGFKYAGDGQPSTGDVLHEEKPPARITSIGELPFADPQTDSQTGALVALGYVRRQFKEPGTRLGPWIVL